MQSTSERVGISLREALPEGRILGSADVRTTSCCSDARQCRDGDLYVALVDPDGDGHDAADEAVRRGAIAILAEHHLPVRVPVCIVPDTREALGTICQQLAGNPADELQMVGVTGTNGKTTTSLLIASVLREAGHRTGVSGSLGHSDSFDGVPAHRTTPHAPEMAELLRQMSANGCSHAVTELSSRGLAQRRNAGIEYDAAVLTNIRRDHLDYHGTVMNYRRAKARLLERLKPHGFAVLNADDAGCQHLLPKLTCPVITFGIREEAEVSGQILERFASEQTFLLTAGNQSVPVRTRMIGDSHLANCLAAAAFGLVAGIDLMTVARGLEAVDRVPARLDRVECGQDFGVFVDCADTPDRLAVSLNTLRKVTPGRVLCVYSASSRRSAGERPMLGRVVERAADVGIITAARQHIEPTHDVTHDILDGYERPARAHAIPSRQQAIRWALDHARPGDSLLIAGGDQGALRAGSQGDCEDIELARSWLYDAGSRNVTLRSGALRYA